MVNIAQAWAEAVHQEAPGRQRPGARRRLGRGHRQPDRRQLRPGQHQPQDEAERNRSRPKANRGGEPKEIIVGYDALAIYVHKRQPAGFDLDRGIGRHLRRRRQRSRRWSQLGVPEGNARRPTKSSRVNRQSSSGTYSYFREAVLGKDRDYKLGSIDANGSKDAVSLVAHTPSAIGYSGMGYATDDVKMLQGVEAAGRAGRGPHGRKRRCNNSYPITRPLQIYVIGEPDRGGEGVSRLDSLARGPEGRAGPGLRAVKMHDEHRVTIAHEVDRCPDARAVRQRRS